MSLDKDALSTLRRGAGEPATGPDPARTRRRRLIIVLVAVILPALTTTWIFRGKTLEAEVATAEAPLAGAGGAVLNASGYVVARRLATVSSKVTGRVTEVLFEEGASVREGQVLARLDDTLPRAQYDVALKQRDAARRALTEVEVRLADARRTLERNQRLRQDNLVSQSALDAAEADAAALAARLESTRAELEVSNSALALRARELEEVIVRAPFTGVVISKDAQPGEMVSPVSAGGGYTRTGIATVVDMDSREIEVDVSESYINRVHADQRAEAVLDAYADWKIPARVIAIVPTADRQKATVKVRIAFNELDPRILPDMGVKVRFYDDRPAATGQKAVASVPVSAVSESDGKSWVWLLRDGRARRVEVRVGDEQAGRRDVLSGLQPGDKVVASPPAELTEGTRVRAKAGG